MADYVLAENRNLKEIADIFWYPAFANNTYRGGDAWAAGNGVLVDDPFTDKGTVLRVRQIKDTWGIGQSDIMPDSPSGVQNMYGAMGASHSTLYHFKKTELFVSMDMAVAPNFMFPPSIHLMQIRGTPGSLPSDTSPTAYCRCRFQLTNGFDYSTMYPGVPRGAIGLYFANQDYTTKKYPRTFYLNPNDPTNPPYGGNGSPDDYLTMTPGKWYSLKFRVKMNDPSSSNGIMEAWCNGKQMLYLDNMRWRGSPLPDAVWDLGEFTTWCGGSGQKFAAPQTQYMYFNNLKIAAPV